MFWRGDTCQIFFEALILGLFHDFFSPKNRNVDKTVENQKRAM